MAKLNKLVTANELKPIRFRNVSDVLKDSQLKKISGGYGTLCEDGLSCFYTSTNHPNGTWSSCMGFNSAIAFCDFWVTAGYDCRCYSK